MKVTNSLVIFSLLLISFISVPNVMAIESTPSATPNPKRQQVRTMIEEKKTERIEKLNSVRKERILNFSNKMIVRLEATTDRIEKLIARIETRITKIEEGENNIKTEPIKESLDEAKQKLSLVKIEITKLQDKIDSMLVDEEPKEVFEEVRTSVNEIRDGLKEVHTILVKLIGDIKGLRVGENKE